MIDNEQLLKIYLHEKKKQKKLQKSYDLKLEKHSTSKAISEIIDDPSKLKKVRESVIN